MNGQPTSGQPTSGQPMSGQQNPTSFTPVTPSRLAELIALRAAGTERAHPVRVAVDGPRAPSAFELASAVADRVRALNRVAVVVESRFFWRDASVRLEYGHTDVDAFYDLWLDAAALQREVLQHCAGGSYLPTLRDPATNRVTRAAYVALPADAVILVAGELLLGRGLDFDVTVHLDLSPAARRRLTAPEWAWTLPAFDRYQAEVFPASVADAVVSSNDPHRPALRWSTRG